MDRLIASVLLSAPRSHASIKASNARLTRLTVILTGRLPPRPRTLWGGGPSLVGGVGSICSSLSRAAVLSRIPVAAIQTLRSSSGVDQRRATAHSLDGR